MIDVSPIYGWGWSNKDGGRVEVPPPFQIDVKQKRERTAQGFVHSGVYGDWQANISARHTLWDGCINVELADNAGHVITGFGTIAIEAFA